MNVILNATNLLGDSFYLLRPVQAFLEQSNDCVAIVADNGLAFEMFLNSFGSGTKYEMPIYFEEDVAKQRFPDAVVLKLGAGQAADLSYKLLKEKGGIQLHISEAYGKLLGVELKDIKPVMSWQRVEGTLPRTFFAISPFSRSCSRHTNEKPNKTLDDHKWEYIIRYLRRHGMPVKVIAGPNDRLSSNSVPVNDYFTANNLYELEYFLKSCALLISLDNGLGHVASALHTPMISLWPAVSNIQFIGPRFSPKTCFVTMEPNNSTPAQLLAGIRHFVRPLLGDNIAYEQEEVLQE